MMLRKRLLAVLLTCLMVLETVIPAFADTGSASLYAGQVVVAINDCLDMVTGKKAVFYEKAKESVIYIESDGDGSLLSGGASLLGSGNEAGEKIPALPSGDGYVNVIEDIDENGRSKFSRVYDDNFSSFFTGLGKSEKTEDVSFLGSKKPRETKNAEDSVKTSETSEVKEESEKASVMSLESVSGIAEISETGEITETGEISEVTEVEEVTETEKPAKSYESSSDTGLLGGGAATTYAVGDTLQFISDYTNPPYDAKYTTIKCLAVGTHCTVWGEINEEFPQLELTTANAEDIAASFESNWDNFESYFGDYKDYDHTASDPGAIKGDTDGDGKLAIVCYDIDEDYAKTYDPNTGMAESPNSYTGGYFLALDLYAGKEAAKQAGIEINSLDCIHVDTFPTMSSCDDNYMTGEADIFAELGNCYSTLFHELQHLTEAAMTAANPLPTFLNEAFSMAAEHLVCGSGCTTSRVNYFNDRYITGSPLTYWCYDNFPFSVLNNYSTSYLFGQYLRTRYVREGKSSLTTGDAPGGDVYGNILTAFFNDSAGTVEECALNAVESVMDESFANLVRDFWMAVALRDSDGSYSFNNGTKVEEWSMGISPQFETELPNGNAGIYNGGAKLYQLSYDAQLTDSENVMIFTNTPDNTCTVDFWVAKPEEVYEDYNKDIEVSYGKTIPSDKLPADPKASDYSLTANYKFTGWYTDAKLTTPFDLKKTITGDTILYGSFYDNDNRKDITITYHSNPEDGSTDKTVTQTVREKEIFNLKPVSEMFEYEGMRFLAWATSAEGSENDDFYGDEETVSFGKGLNLYAIWIDDADFYIYFDANGGEPDYYGGVAAGETVMVPTENPVREGYGFTGWYTDEECTKKFDFSTVIDTYLILYAGWKKQFTVFFDANGGTADSTVTVLDGDTVARPTVIPKRSGYSFNGWFTDKGGFKRYDFGTPVTSDLTLYADWDDRDDDSDVSYTPQLPSYVVRGSWSVDAAGWHFKDSKDHAYVNEWVAAYNPYAKGSQPQYDWFRFDRTGTMITGWFTDTDGNVYYLKPVSDGTMGSMVTGWYQIDGTWYYFNTLSNGTKGALLRNTISPDGYRVGADGAWVK